MPLNPQHYSSVTLIDFSKELSTMRFYMGAITAGSLPGFLTQFGALRTAVDGITLGNIAGDKWVGDDTNYAAAAPTDPNAQRERKWLVTYEGVTTHSIYTVTIPTADIAGTDFLLPGTDEADLATTEIAAFVTAFEAIARTPEGENVNVLGLTAVGRNN